MSWLSVLNPLSVLKYVKLAAVIGVVSYGLIMVNSFLKDQRELRDAVIVSNAEKVSAQARAETFAHANQQLEAIIETEKRFRVEQEKALVEINENFAEIKVEQERQSQVLEGDRLSRLAGSRKKNLIVRLSNKATAERFRSVEAIFDGN